MAGHPTLEELEAYGQEVYHAQREGRVPKYRDPREVYQEDPNRDSFLVEKTEAEINEEQKAVNDYIVEKAEMDEQVRTELAANGNVVHGGQVTPDAAAPENPEPANLSDEQVDGILAAADNSATDLEDRHPTDPTPTLADPGQDLAHTLAAHGDANHDPHQGAQQTGGEQEMTELPVTPAVTPEAATQSIADTSSPVDGVPETATVDPNIIPPAEGEGVQTPAAENTPDDSFEARNEIPPNNDVAGGTVTPENTAPDTTADPSNTAPEVAPNESVAGGSDTTTESGSNTDQALVDNPNPGDTSPTNAAQPVDANFPNPVTPEATSPQDANWADANAGGLTSGVAETPNPDRPDNNEG